MKLKGLLPCLLVDSTQQQERLSLWELAYVPALTASLEISSSDIGLLNLCHCEVSVRQVTTKDLDTVRNSSFVIVDTTDPSPRTLILVGYALANRKRIVQVHWSDAGQPLDIAESRVRRYHNAEDLKIYLINVVGYLHAKKGPNHGDEIHDLFMRCGFPLVVLEGDGKYEYALPQQSGTGPISINMTKEKFAPPEPWRSEFETVSRRVQEFAKSTGAVLFNGDLVRIKDYTPLRDERSGRRGIRLDAQPTDYFMFVSSNHSWDFLSVETATRLRSMESARFSNLRDSVLANPLTVSISLVMRDGGKEWLVMQHRNTEKNFHGKQDFQCAAAGMVSATRDMRSGVVDVYAAACNELREETGVWVTEQQVSFAAFLRETRFREVGLVGEVCLSGDVARIIAPHADAFESSGFFLCEATPEAFVELLQQNLPVDRFAPLGVGAITFSLLRRFSQERVEEALSSINPA